MALTGPTAALAHLVSQLATAGKVPREAKTQLATIALARVRAGFEDSADPTGAAWAALRYRRGRPLVLTGKLRRSFRKRLFAGGFAIETSVPYAGFHQGGTRHIDARRMLPRDGTIPEPWRAAFERVIDAALSRHFGP